MNIFDEYVRINIMLDNIHASLNELLAEREKLSEATRRIDILIGKHIDFMNKLDDEIN